MLGKNPNIANSYEKYFYSYLYSSEEWERVTWFIHIQYLDLSNGLIGTLWTASLETIHSIVWWFLGNLEITHVCPPQRDSSKCLQKTKSHLFVRNIAAFLSPERFKNRVLRAQTWVEKRCWLPHMNMYLSKGLIVSVAYDIKFSGNKM